MGCTEGRDVVPERCGCDGSELTKVTLEKGGCNRAFGARVVDTETKDVGLLIVRVTAGGALSKWNAVNPSMAIGPGDSIVEANGLTEPWAIMEEMARVVKVGMVVRRAPPGGKALLAQCKVTSQSLQTTALVLKQTVQACDVSVDTCAICLEDVEADERIAGLKCGHGFHQRCIMRWLGRCETSGCPLCREAVH
mmetsp:Transcript_98130/g.277777  ORF Transcript_98130/g.277777 Transcript_98130/m.277777 type:complete len:194 (-) Transcript_98130:13-594(-)